MCSIILLYVFLICVHYFLLDTMFTRNIKFKSKSKKKKSTLVSSSSNVGDHAVNLEKDYEETSNEKDIDQGSTIEEDKLDILLLTYTIFRQIDNKIEERYLNVIVLSPKIIYFYQVV